MVPPHSCRKRHSEEFVFGERIRGSRSTFWVHGEILIMLIVYKSWGILLFVLFDIIIIIK